MRFRETVALITAAGSGIGRATTEIVGGEGGVVLLLRLGPAELVPSLRI